MFDRLKSLFSKSGASALVNAQEYLELPAPFELKTCAGVDVERCWQSLRSQPGVIPILLGEPKDAKYSLEGMELNEEGFDEVLRLGLATDVDDWLEGQRQADPDGYSELDESDSGQVPAMPVFSPARSLLTGKSKKEVVFGLVPAAHPWEVAAQLRPGGWNECPEPAVHVAFFKRWSERYGAVPITVTNDIIEFHVDKPPRTREAALELAREQYVYCNDIVHQGVQSVGRLASALMNCPNWYFWWD